MLLYVKAPYDEVLKEIQRTGNTLTSYKNAFCVEIKDMKNIELYLKKIEFNKDENSEVEKLANYEGGNSFNLSKNEIKLLKDFKKDTNKIATTFFKHVLLDRIKSYMKYGINGIETYEHCEEGDTLEDGFEKSNLSMKVFKRDFSHLYNYYINYPKVSPTKQMKEKYFVIKDKVDERVAFILKHQIIEQKNSLTIIAQRQFYISNSLDGIQTQILCSPYRDGTLVVLSSQSYTDKVAGFARGFAVEIGRKMMKKQIIPMFENLKRKYN
jgi:hypothetical protein